MITLIVILLVARSLQILPVKYARICVWHCQINTLVNYFCWLRKSYISNFQLYCLRYLLYSPKFEEFHVSTYFGRFNL